MVSVSGQASGCGWGRKSDPKTPILSSRWDIELKDTRRNSCNTPAVDSLTKQV